MLLSFTAPEKDRFHISISAEVHRVVEAAPGAFPRGEGARAFRHIETDFI